MTEPSLNICNPQKFVRVSKESLIINNYSI